MKKYLAKVLIFISLLSFVAVPMNALVAGEEAVYVSQGGSEFETGTFRLELQVGDKGQIRRPNDSPFKDTVYSFSAIVEDPSILSFDEQGNWVALKPGKTRVLLTFPTSDSEQGKKFEEELKGSTVPYQVQEVAVYYEVTVSATNIAVDQVVYRLYNPNNREHFYTVSQNERDTLVRIGWGQYEGIAFTSPATGTEIYRLYNPILKDHHYTSDLNEIKILISQYNWINEGIQWHSGGEKAVHRLFHSGLVTGSHHYTADENEVDTLQSRGWKYEGIAWYSRK
ncbi:hypothetical protein GGG87_08570 [Streptococcus sp. zg-86]|uniref:DUF5648 domain-containing protein n=1 Tax=Streptococcus zhangguiae TaxID=2664091 RepID=A0A6I4RC06_9STRE|nr:MULTISPECIES: hypothetical protein [unclassified Streptococcus]MTB65047.1 hypothetical protein [Streptococcus sp. zg-86]MTB91266.1 hypothetical protein [Streptococcus sp. zg-36]MWV57039.1 hypothetical protein [Streptococcus sp. zg-70]QTH47540.1 hypothetical protein J5M87_08360 [Streptococcus sp. zg-86]